MITAIESGSLNFSRKLQYGYSYFKFKSYEDHKKVSSSPVFRKEEVK